MNKYQDDLTDEERDLMLKDIEEKAKEFEKQSKKLLAEISSRTNQLEDLSEKFGIPFNLNDQTYVPKSILELYPMDENALLDKMQYYGSYFDEYISLYGWKNSSVVSC